jgi:hypothetical protein
VILNLNSELNDEETKNLLIHETQHPVQDIEGFAKGANYERVFQRVLQERKLTLLQYESLQKKKEMK